jgi:hypothetical protein
MKIYEVKYTPVSVDGWSAPDEIAKRFSSMKKAKRYVEEQEELWQKHTDERKAISPCWFDRKKEMTIVPVEVE